MTGIQTTLIAATIALALAGAMAGLGAATANAMPPKNDAPAVTEYLELAGFSLNEKTAAEQLSELHQSHYDRGRQVIDVELHQVHGSLRGFFVTYVER